MPSDTIVGTPDVAPASCHTTADTVKGVPVTTAGEFDWATDTKSLTPSNPSARPPRPAIQLLSTMNRNVPDQLVDVEFETTPPAPSSNVQRATNPSSAPPSDTGSNS